MGKSPGSAHHRTLYPAIDPYRTGRLQVSTNPTAPHELYFEESGNPQGTPVLFVHGGPGGATSPLYRRFFDPSKYRIIMFDQRGCGQSTPHASLVDNTTWDLVADMEKLRHRLGVQRWVVFGGSWGSTLGLAYSQAHPERVRGIVLRGIFMVRAHELQWYYQQGASFIFPDRWEGFRDAIPEAERGDLLAAYRHRLTGDDKEEMLKAAKAWTQWEMGTSNLYTPEQAEVEKGKSEDAHFAAAFARIENHFFYNKGWFEDEGQLLRGVDSIRGIPAVIVQGRYDCVCPMTSAWDLHKAWPQADFRVIPDAGHSCFEPGTLSALVEACDEFAALE